MLVASPFPESSILVLLQSTPLLAGLGVAVAAYGSKYALEALQRYRARPPVARARKYYEGGFQPVMTRREAALILGVR